MDARRYVDPNLRRGTGRLGLLVFVAAAALAPPAALAQATAPVAAEKPRSVWVDPEGAPLPFASDDELMEFLRTASVVSRKTTETGITKPWKLLLEKDGIRAHAIFRYVEVEKKQTRVSDRTFLRFRDSAACECAAYVLARALGLDNVPPAVPRTLRMKEGSVQIWVEDARDQKAGDFRPPNISAWVKQLWDMGLFDNLILNVDRNIGNQKVSQDYKLWLIDHTRAFQPKGELLTPEKLRKINRQAWDRLQAMSDDELQDLVRDYLDGGQVQALVQRRQLLVELVTGLVEELGEDVVFY
jgi:hypothetical protein